MTHQQAIKALKVLGQAAQEGLVTRNKIGGWSNSVIRTLNDVSPFGKELALEFRDITYNLSLDRTFEEIMLEARYALLTDIYLLILEESEKNRND